MAAPFVRVVYEGKSTNVDLDGKIRTFSDIAKAAAIEHLGNRFPSEVTIGALSLHGPIAAVSKESALAELAHAGDVEFSEGVDCVRITNGSWFLLHIDASVAGKESVINFLNNAEVYPPPLSPRLVRRVSCRRPWRCCSSSRRVLPPHRAYFPVTVTHVPCR
jgi:hypothetical protein